VRSGGGGPGPNSWSASNAWVDASGALHLRVSKQNGVWKCAEVYLDTPLGFGTYEWDVTGPIDTIDPNIVLGLFDYPTADVGPDGTNEIDIEFSQWGSAANKHGNFTVWPPALGPVDAHRSFAFTLPANKKSTQRFIWNAGSIDFRSLRGFTTGNSPTLYHWLYSPTSPTQHIPQSPTPVHMNLWLFDGHAPANGQSVTITINDFRFIPG